MRWRDSPPQKCGQSASQDRPKHRQRKHIGSYPPLGLDRTMGGAGRTAAGRSWV